ncbi:MAG: iron-containing alcohol dehydrogenase [Kiritimatiellaeota bacterium]|nr:iron-containing alcohol dehydrogenase [Kiritimatiellota bacterium]
MWTFKLPTEVRFGPGTSGELPGLTARFGGRPVLITDRGLAGLPFFLRIADLLEPVAVFAEVEPNPTVTNVDELCRLLRREKADVAVAVGGGSAMDCAKAAACLARSSESSVRAFHTGGLPLPLEHLPVVAVPTTAGTGAEVTPFSVLDDREKGVKGPLAGPALYPTLAVIDPRLTHSMPRYVTVCTGLDALCHAIEGYWSKHHQPICDLLAVEAARLVFRDLETACRVPEDAPAREGMAYAALLAGAAFQLPKNGMVHACSFPLSNRYHLAHGAACAFTLEFAIRHNTPALDGRMERFAAACGFDSVAAMIGRITALKQLGGLPCTLDEAGVPAEDVPAVIAESFHPLMQNNPAPVAPADLARMYNELAGDS